MDASERGKHFRLAQMVEIRAGVGRTEVVSGWQKMLIDLLGRMRPYMQPGNLVTFQKLTAAETVFFQRLHDELRLPQSAVGLYLPPSVRIQMLGDTTMENETGAAPDAGVVIACHVSSFDVIVNALFAFSPFTPAVDVYDRGRLVAGYQYLTIDECRSGLSEILDRHLVKPSTKT